ncbi:hypothetical protein DLAC_07151 [Tieghemostelium lacteum]|uniref:Transglycosylase SLT domain-containing protein n=1 Tax=Tieghemostelium lacteum TaxID=361077 RepID=A0A151ZD89_TIELA|nr:hypothetical protein DLAC_07151 [Tieghemostelium lacteum]|eukprot:KYQ91916.1 hypothetical protein DLAC_07151 [Tieghemostelium lacteum]
MRTYQLTVLLIITLLSNSVLSEVLDCAQVQALVTQFFNDPNEQNIMVCIAYYESSWNTYAKDPNGNFGLFQINAENCGQGEICSFVTNENQLLDPTINTQCAFAMSNAVGFNVWPAYANGDCDNWSQCLITSGTSIYTTTTTTTTPTTLSTSGQTTTTTTTTSTGFYTSGYSGNSLSSSSATSATSATSGNNSSATTTSGSTTVTSANTSGQTTTTTGYTSAYTTYYSSGYDNSYTGYSGEYTSGYSGSGSGYYLTKEKQNPKTKPKLPNISRPKHSKIERHAKSQ